MGGLIYELFTLQGYIYIYIRTASKVPKSLACGYPTIVKVCNDVVEVNVI